jgi:predicted Holliday junction resolvase-like endonuclease
MTILDTFTLTVLLILFYFVKNYYDKYQTTSNLFKNLLKEIEVLNKSCETYSDELVDLRARITIITQAQDSKEDTIKTLKQKITLQENSHIVKLELLEKDFQLKIKEGIKSAREDAIARSRSVLRGQASEHLAPFVMKTTNPKDYRFMGNPIDYICFEGLSDLLDGVSDKITSVHFIDIKTGKASLNKSQRRIRDAINESRVQFSVINLDKELEEQNNQTKAGSKTNSTDL